MFTHFHNIKNLVQHRMDFSHYIMHTIQHIIKCEQDYGYNDDDESNVFIPYHQTALAFHNISVQV